MSIRQNLENRKFGKLLVLSRKNGKWRCKCDCGKITYVNDSWGLTSGHKRSCGCLSRPHGRHGEKAYKIWKNMRSRCLSPSSSGYHKYGARGITVCEQWSDFNKFIEDMGEIPSDDYSIDRIDPNGNYEPQNCRWIPLSEQRWNKRTSRKITYNGQTKNLNQWAKELNIKRETLKSRLDKGFDDEATLSSIIKHL